MTKPTLTLDELIIAAAMMNVQLTSKVTNDSEITISTSDGADYIYNVQLSPEAKLIPRRAES